MMSERKGMTMALGVIIAIVVLIVVALAVIAITSGALSRFGGGTDEQQAMAAAQTKCESWFTQWCISHPGQSAPSEYLDVDVTIGGNTQTFGCDDIELLGDDRVCAGSN